SRDISALLHPANCSAPTFLFNRTLAFVPTIQNLVNDGVICCSATANDKIIPRRVDSGENLATVCFPTPHQFDESVDGVELVRPVLSKVFGVCSRFPRLTISMPALFTRIFFV